MPAFITHYLYGIDMFHQQSNPFIKQILYQNQNAYKLGLQGPDLFYFDLTLVLGSSEYNLGDHMHEHKVSQFFQYYLEELDQLNGEEFNCGMAYLCGLLGHYALDSYIHPYIYYRTGYSPAIPGSSQASFPTHGTLEALIDKQMLLEKKSMMPSQFYPNKTIGLSKKEKAVIASTMSSALNATYHSFLSNSSYDAKITTPRKIRKAITAMKYETLLLHDPKGRKQKSIRSIERLIKKEGMLSSLFNNDTLTDTMDACNRSHTLWHNPWDQTIVSNDSFDDLYNKSSRFYQDITERLHSYIASKATAWTERKIFDRLLDTIGNRSYHSGLDVG